ncbi:MAG TPA: hypothetical protein VM578_07285 [Candidatus Saccharimonadales bacterium]|nr:hypothetical protein [Candidatus Saccharimonadales bacterium]
MFNLIAINLKDAQGNLFSKCHLAKCGNPGRYQLFNPLSDGDLPDWEGLPICSKHLVEEARHRPEIIMSMLDILIDAMEAKKILSGPPAPHGGSRVIPMR